MNIRDEIDNKLILEMERQQADAIIDEVRRFLKHCISFEEILNRARLERYPDGTDIFFFDEEPVIKFYPIEITRSYDDHAYKYTFTRKVVKLKTGGKNGV